MSFLSFALSQLINYLSFYHSCSKRTSNNFSVGRYRNLLRYNHIWHCVEEDRKGSYQHHAVPSLQDDGLFLFCPRDAAFPVGILNYFVSFCDLIKSWGTPGSVLAIIWPFTRWRKWTLHCCSSEDSRDDTKKQHIIFTLSSADWAHTSEWSQWRVERQVLVLVRCFIFQNFTEMPFLSWQYSPLIASLRQICWSIYSLNSTTL